MSLRAFGAFGGAVYFHADLQSANAAGRASQPQRGEEKLKKKSLSRVCRESVESLSSLRWIGSSWAFGLEALGSSPRLR